MRSSCQIGFPINLKCRNTKAPQTQTLLLKSLLAQVKVRLTLTTPFSWVIIKGDSQNLTLSNKGSLILQSSALYKMQNNFGLSSFHFLGLKFIPGFFIHKSVQNLIQKVVGTFMYMFCSKTLACFFCSVVEEVGETWYFRFRLPKGPGIVVYNSKGTFLGIVFLQDVHKKTLFDIPTSLWNLNDPLSQLQLIIINMHQSLRDVKPCFGLLCLLSAYYKLLQNI